MFGSEPDTVSLVANYVKTGTARIHRFIKTASGLITVSRARKQREPRYMIIKTEYKNNVIQIRDVNPNIILIVYNYSHYLF